ncbi:MAG: flagella basal body P-ring formation protein FlgA [Gammaproteobacteria bacterium]|nr:flagella basal body P-ring formation protein FlgA [Gammaproteobacteria bacterium]
MMKYIPLFTLIFPLASFGANVHLCESKSSNCQLMAVNDGDVLSEKLASYIVDKLTPDNITRVNLEFLQATMIDETNSNCQVTLKLPKVILKERLNIEREIECKNSKSNKNELNKDILWAKAKYFGNHTIAATIIPQFSNIDATNSKLVELEVKQLSTKGRELLACSKVASLDIKEGEVISTSNSMCEQTVQKGEDITVLFSQGVVSYKLGALALASGKEGEVINVKFKHNGRVIPAKVIDKGIAKYD